MLQVYTKLFFHNELYIYGACVFHAHRSAFFPNKKQTFSELLAVISQPAFFLVTSLASCNNNAD